MISKELSSESIKESQAVISSKISEPVIYDPPPSMILSRGSTSMIARVKPGVVLKFPRYSWWHSETAETHTFVKEIKRSFNVEEQLPGILGVHPRIIRYVGPSSINSLR